jgi:hypothetical protein
MTIFFLDLATRDKLTMKNKPIRNATVFAAMMFFTNALFIPWAAKDELTSKSILINLVIWALSGCIFFLFLKNTQNKV